MERADWLEGRVDSADARFLMVTAITHHQFSSPIWGAREVRKLQAELAEIAKHASEILKEHQAGVTVADVCHKHGISEPTFYRWQSLQSGNVGLYAKRVRALEEENQKLKKLLAEAMLSAATLSEMLAKTPKG